MNAWPGSQQVLVGPFQQIPGLTAATAASSQRPVTQQILPDSLTHPQHMLSDNWRQSFVLDGLDQAQLAQLVSTFNIFSSPSLPKLENGNRFKVHSIDIYGTLETSIPWAGPVYLVKQCCELACTLLKRSTVDLVFNPTSVISTRKTKLFI